MRCRPRPGSRFYSLDRLLRRKECWELLCDLITPPCALRRGRNARRHSGTRHVPAPAPTRDPSLRLARFGFLFLFFFGPFHGWAHPPPQCLNLLSLDFTFFSSFHTCRKLPHPFSGPAQEIKWPRQANLLRPLGVVYVSQRAFRPEPNETRRRSLTLSLIHI